jgi:sulfoquinovose isomerase
MSGTTNDDRGHAGPDQDAPVTGREDRPSAAGTSWRALPSHRAWLDDEFARLLAFPRDPVHPQGGFAWLDDHGRPDLDQPVHIWITARMTHVHALAHLRGLPGATSAVEAGVDALTGRLRDDEHGGWFTEVAADGTPGTDKEAYTHAFVVLAATSATAAGHPDGPALLDDALEVLDRRFWEPDTGRSAEAFDRDWSTSEPYRGTNSNMHTVEALLAAADVTGDDEWLRRASSIAEHLIDDVARAHDWRLVEHFSPTWEPRLEHHRDQPDHPFRPYGTTIGHWLEWGRLLLHLEAALAARDLDTPRWLEQDARALIDRSFEVGWAADGAPGFPYTLDWDDRPVVRARMHWVVAEAIAAAAALHERTGEDTYEAWYRRCWDHAATAFLDRERGSWHHELSPELTPAAGTWGGKPDLYHAVQATLLPQLALAPALAPQLAATD